jgi:hypothetical protein
VGRDKEMKSKWVLAMVAVLLLVSVAGAGLALANQKPLD